MNVVGVAGIGKSRLIQEALSRALAEDGRLDLVRARALPSGSGIPLHLVSELVEELTGAEEAGSGGMRGLSRADAGALAWLRRGGDEHDVVAERELALQRALHAVRSLLERRAHQSGLLVVVCEDIHWADSAVLDFLDRFGEAVRAPVLILCLTRPDRARRRDARCVARASRHR